MTEQQAVKLGNYIRDARLKQGLSIRGVQAALAEVQVTLSWLKYLEDGRSLEPLPDRLAKVIEYLKLDPAKVDRISGNYLAQSLPNVRTYFRSAGKATKDELDELEKVIAEVQAKYRGGNKDSL